MNKVTRGEKFLQRLVDQDVISECGRDWLIAAIDPFHDHQLQHLQGWPDLESGFSVVRCIKQSVTVARPATIPATDNWDCHIVHWPWLRSSIDASGNFCATTSRNGNCYTIPAAPATLSPVGGLQIYGVTAGGNLSILQPAGGTTVQIGSLDIDPSYTQGAGRLCASGFEVHNTTADLQKQGSAAVWRMMANSEKSTTFNFTKGANTGTYTGIEVRYPPQNLKEALLMAGTKQWEAREGCYVVACFDNEDNPAFPVSPTMPVILAAGNDDTEGSINTGALNVGVGSAPLAGTTQVPMSSLRVHPIHQCGAIFSGLSPTTTLTINWNVYYESFPALSQLTILPLASPSCEFDPDALDLYSRILVDLPVGVKVKENGLGDWFMDAVSTAARYLAPALSALPHPIAKGAGALAQYIGDTMPQKRALPAPPAQSPWVEGKSNKAKANKQAVGKPNKPKQKPKNAQPAKQGNGNK